MKGTINLHEKWGWGVINHTDESIPDWIPLHPDDLTYFAEMKEKFDNFEARVLSSPEVEFETIIHNKFTGRIIYAKLNPKEEPKQETLEEGASKWSLEEAQEFALSRFKNENLLLEGFVSLESILKVFKSGILTGHKFGAKWQQEQDKNKYSEEEVLSFLNDMNSWPTIFNDSEDIREWFEQFKKN